MARRLLEGIWVDHTIIQSIARELLDAEMTRLPIPPVTSTYPELSVAEAYAVQSAYARLRAERGADLVGRKIGATSAAIQDLFNVRTPDFGHLFREMEVPNRGVVRRDVLIAPMVEPEVGFRLKLPLAGPGITRGDVLTATRAVLPAIEIIDSRIRHWEIEFRDTVADNGSSGRFILGDEVDVGAVQDLSKEEVRLVADGVLVDRASGSAVLGHPAEAVAWLANALAEFGEHLSGGQLVLSGSFCRAVVAHRDVQYSARFDTLGEVSCAFG